jgi:hypothetical protein
MLKNQTVSNLLNFFLNNLQKKGSDIVYDFSTPILSANRNHKDS